jgi:hypothetical protein
MMKFNVKALFAAAMMCAIVAGCNENTNDPDPVGLAAPTALMANSNDFQSVNLKWTASTSATTADFANYELIVTPANGTAMTPITIAKGATTYTVTGLIEGTVYTFSLRSKSTATTNNMSSAATVQWSPATRHEGVRVYETASTQFGSGIDLSNIDKSNGMFGSTKLANGANWDLALDTRVINGQIDNGLGSPSVLTYVIKNSAGDTIPGRATLISSKVVSSGATSLDDVFETQALGDATVNMKPDSARYIRVDNFSNNIVFFARTVEGNFAKVLVKAAGDKLLQGTAPNRYVEMDISYQSAANVPYAFVRGGNSPWNFGTTSISSSKKASE